VLNVKHTPVDTDIERKEYAMTIDRLGPVDPASKFNKTEKPNRPEKNEKTDSINVSEEAKNLGELYKASENVKQSPDIRYDRVEEVKERLKDPNYLSDRVLEATAEKIMDAFGI